MSVDKLVSSKNEVKESMSLSEKKGKLTQEVRVREIENGYIVTISKYGDDSKGNYINEDKEYFSKTNPLNKNSTEETQKSLFEKTYDNIKEMM